MIERIEQSHQNETVAEAEAEAGRGYGRGNGGYGSTKRKIEQLEQAIDDMTSQGVPEQGDAQRSAISQVTTTGESVMGGRAAQSRQYGGRGGGRGWS